MIRSPALKYLSASAALVFAIAFAPLSAASTTDFESFAPGTVNYQGPGGTTTTAAGYLIPNPYGSLWTVADEWGFGVIPFDQTVQNDGTGNTVLRLSNAVASGSHADQTTSPSAPAVAGEAGAALWNDRGPVHTTPTGPAARASSTTPYFHAGFRFKSATGAAQPGLVLNLSPNARQSNWRMSSLTITDTGAGIDLGFFDSNAVGGFSSTTVAPGLSYTDWHTVDFYIQFVDGLNGDGSGNDIVQIVVDGALVHTGTTWETYYRLTYPARLHAVDAFMFRSSTAAAGNAGNGIFFDNVVVDNAVPPPPDLVITKTDGATTATPGATVTYTIVASNVGAGNATGATVTDTLPASLTGATWTCVGAIGGTCTAAGSGNISDTVNLPAGGSVTYTLTATVSPSATGTLTNTATVATAAVVTDPNPNNNSATDTDTLILVPDLSITKTVSGSGVAGTNVSYLITVTNSGMGVANSVVVTDLLPAGLTFVSAAPSQGAYVAATGIWTVGTVAAQGGTATLTIVAAVNMGNGGRVIQNTAAITSSVPADPTPGTGAATATITVAGAMEPAPIPTLSATALLLLAIGLAFAGWFARRREV